MRGRGGGSARESGVGCGGGENSSSRENRRGVAGGGVGSSWSTKAVTMLIR